MNPTRRKFFGAAPAVALAVVVPKPERGPEPIPEDLLAHNGKLIGAEDWNALVRKAYGHDQSK